MKKKISALLLACVFVVCMLASCGAQNIVGKEYRISKIELEFGKDASTYERYLFLESVRCLSGNEKMNEKKALKWAEDFVEDLSKNYVASFSDTSVTENFFEMSTSMVKETDAQKIEQKTAALINLAEQLFNLNVFRRNSSGEIIESVYSVTINADGLSVVRNGATESRYIVSSYSRYINFAVDSDHPLNNSDGYIAQAFTRGDTLMYSSGKIKQTIEKDGFIMNITYKKK